VYVCVCVYVCVHMGIRMHMTMANSTSSSDHPTIITYPSPPSISTPRPPDPWPLTPNATPNKTKKPPNKHRNAVEFLAGEGHIYTTTDESHYKATA
jgi:hypothetical protein